jgi:hypothetical protein
MLLRRARCVNLLLLTDSLRQLVGVELLDQSLDAGLGAVLTGREDNSEATRRSALQL